MEATQEAKKFGKKVAPKGESSMAANYHTSRAKRGKRSSPICIDKVD
jgi:hypothetical protein